jgi:hypothetical protein
VGRRTAAIVIFGIVCAFAGFLIGQSPYRTGGATHWPPLTDIYWPTLGLVVVGAAAAVVGICTLKKLEEQARFMERQTKSIHHQAVQVRRQTHILNKSAAAAQKAAEAAQDSSAALINSERAWLIAELVPTATKFAGRWYKPVGNNMGELSDAELADGKQFEYQLKVTNMGKTPAYVTRYTISRSNGTDEGQLIDFGLPHRSLASSERWYLCALDVEREVKNYAAEEKVLFFGNIFYQHVFSNKDTIRESFAYFFKRENGRLERIPLPDDKAAKQPSLEPPNCG